MNEDLKYDVRLVRHHMRRQILDKKQLDEHLGKLPDDAAHGVDTDTRFVGYSDRARSDRE
ncbi:MAG: hypothetical protein H6737_07735 [Alphaproteobacteria bacterium]|nr:hypothetical protein [Alphaproteobacteria bacterium]